MRRLMLAGLFAVSFAPPVLAQSTDTVDAAKGAPRDTPVVLTGHIGRLAGGGLVLRGATGAIALDLQEAGQPEQELEDGAEVTITGRVDRTLLPSHDSEIVERWPAVASVIVERIEVAR